METEFFLLKLEDIKNQIHQTLTMSNDLMIQSELARTIEEINGTILAFKGE